MSARWTVDLDTVGRPDVEGEIDEGHEIPIDAEWTDRANELNHHGAKVVVYGVYDENLGANVLLAQRIAELLNADPVVQALMPIERIGP